MPAERQPKRAPALSRRPVDHAGSSRTWAGARLGVSPADLQARLGNRGTQSFLTRLTQRGAIAAERTDATNPASAAMTVSLGTRAPARDDIVTAPLDATVSALTRAPLPGPRFAPGEPLESLQPVRDGRPEMAEPAAAEASAERRP